MKYMIHSCNDRQWYVDEFLVPELLNQGIQPADIFIYQDKDCDGNLKSFYKSCKAVYDKWGADEKVCHLQDDVYPASYFREEAEYYAGLDKYILICGFTTFYPEIKEPGEGVLCTNLWFSFPCIIYSNKLAIEFYEWCNEYLWGKNMFKTWITRNKGDDYIFECFLQSNYQNSLIYNVAPNLVEHIDFLLGGSVVNRQRKKTNVRSKYWKEEEDKAIKELEIRIKERNGGC